MKIRVLLLCLAATHTPLACGGEAMQFFRMSSASNSILITAFTPDGVLWWSNQVATGEYLVERSRNHLGELWEPLTRGRFSNHVWSVKAHDPSPPPGMEFIPGGLFIMGDDIFATPTHPVIVSPYFIRAHEINNEEMRSVLQWAYDQDLIVVTTNGVESTEGPTNVLMTLGGTIREIQFSNGAFTIRAGRELYPAAYVSWYGAVAFCNYLSLMEGREVCYRLPEWSCDFTKKGYRLPTEAEWEFAARGGYEGKRFPWPDADTITHNRANYKSDTNNWYDVSPTRGFHPDYADQLPRSSPVGTFPANSFGLFDMSGNVWEWCWEWSYRYSSALQYDPTGPVDPVAGVFRIFRGGSWFTTAERVTCAVRYRSAEPSSSIVDVGFRPVIPIRN